MIISALKETNEHENRVAISPDTCKLYIKEGLTVYIEKSAGLNSSFLDSAYLESGAKILEREEILKKSDIIVNVSSIIQNTDLSRLKKNIILIYLEYMKIYFIQ